MTLDKVITIAIGRDSSDGVLPQYHWDMFRTQLRDTVAAYAQVVADTTGYGIGSDGDRDGAGEETAVIVAVNPRDRRALRAQVGKLLAEYGQSSACFALDGSHRPAWPTKSGARTSKNSYQY